MSHYHLGVNTHDGEGDIFSNLCRCAWNDSLHFNQWTGYQMYVFFFSCYTLKGNNTMYNGSHYVYKKTDINITQSIYMVNFLQKYVNIFLIYLSILIYITSNRQYVIKDT